MKQVDPTRGVCELYGRKGLTMLIYQVAIISTLPITLFFVLSRSVTELLVKCYNGTTKMNEISYFLEDNDMPEIFVWFGIGLTQLLLVFPITVALLPLAFYWMLYKTW